MTYDVGGVTTADLIYGDTGNAVCMPLDCASDTVSRIDGEISTAEAKLRCAATDHPLSCSL